MLCDPVDYSLTGSSIHGDSPDKNTGVGCHALLQGIFPTWGLNLGLLHCRQILYHLSHQGSPRILEWVAYPFSRFSSQSRNWTRVSCIAGGFFTSWATREALCVSTQRSCFSYVKNAIVHFIEITLNLKIALGSIVILTILIFSIQEHGVFFSFVCVILDFFH